MKELFVLARENDGINRWLSQNPLVLGLIFLAIGAVVGVWGLHELSTGVAHTKHGRAVTGGTAKAFAIMRIVLGAAAILFGLYKILSA